MQYGWVRQIAGYDDGKLHISFLSACLIGRRAFKNRDPPGLDRLGGH